MSLLRYGIIGSGTMGLEHIQNIALIPDSTVTAIADTDAGSRASAAALAGEGVEVFEDYRDMLKQAPIDAVIIGTPNHTHRVVLEDIIRLRPLPVLIEKPLCASLQDARAMAEMGRDFGAPLWVAMEYRYMPPVARLIDEVRAGTAGTLHMLALREHRFPFLQKVGDWNRFARNTGGTMVEKCCHFFDLMRLIMQDEPVRIYASGGQDVNHLDESYNGEMPDIIDNAFTIVDFKRGGRAALDLCMFAEGALDQEEIAATGDKARIECFIPRSEVVISRREPKAVDVIPIAVDQAVLDAGHHHGSTYYEHLAFQDAVRNGAPVEVTMDDGVRAVAMGAAAEQSIVEKRPIELDEELQPLD